MDVAPDLGKATGTGCCEPLFVWQNRADLQANSVSAPTARRCWNERAANPHVLSPVDRKKVLHSQHRQTIALAVACLEMSLSYAIFF